MTTAAYEISRSLVQKLRKEREALSCSFTTPKKYNK
jgi:hypothetical protein